MMNDIRAYREVGLFAYLQFIFKCYYITRYLTYNYFILYPLQEIHPLP